MKYTLLDYDVDRSLDDLAAPEKRALHAALHKSQNTSSGVTVVAHYRFRPAHLAAHRTATRLSEPLRAPRKPAPPRSHGLEVTVEGAGGVRSCRCIALSFSC